MMMLKTGNKGFTLVEVMAAVAVLALGSVLIFEAFFRSIDVSNYCERYLDVAMWMDEKIWEAQDEAVRMGELAHPKEAGEFSKNGKDFSWELLSVGVGEGGFHKIDLSVSWRKGEKKVKIKRTAYALAKKK